MLLRDQNSLHIKQLQSSLVWKLERKAAKVALPVTLQAPQALAPAEPQGPAQATPDATASLPPDCVPWLHVARQILADEFDGCDHSTRESLTIGLRSIAHPACRRALERLQTDSAKA